MARLRHRAVLACDLEEKAGDVMVAGSNIGGVGHDEDGDIVSLGAESAGSKGILAGQARAVKSPRRYS